MRASRRRQSCQRPGASSRSVCVIDLRQRTGCEPIPAASPRPWVSFYSSGKGGWVVVSFSVSKAASSRLKEAASSSLKDVLQAADSRRLPQADSRLPQADSRRLPRVETRTPSRPGGVRCWHASGRNPNHAGNNPCRSHNPAVGKVHTNSLKRMASC